MGRPSKKSNNETGENMTVETETTESGYEMTHHTFGVTEVDGKVYVARIEFNPVTKLAKVVNLEAADGRADAQNRFRVNVAREVFKSS